MTQQQTSDEAKETGDEYRTKERIGGGLAVDVIHESGHSMLINAGHGGYSLDVWWGEDNQNQAGTRLRLGDQSTQYPYENEHDRDAELGIHTIDGQEVVTVVDPEPKTQAVGYDPAVLIIEFVADEGFHVTAEWVGEETGELRESFAIAPIFDPRNEGEDESYYRFLAEEYRNEDPTHELIESLSHRIAELPNNGSK